MFNLFDRWVDSLSDWWKAVVFAVLLLYILGGAACFAIAMLRGG